MTQLKNLILYREQLNNPASDITSMADNFYVLPALLAGQIADYMTNEKFYIFGFLSGMRDIYDPRDIVRDDDYSDGVYCWDGVLAHWVRKYQVRLPQEFLDHFERVKYTPISYEVLDVPSMLERVENAERILLKPQLKPLKSLLLYREKTGHAAADVASIEDHLYELSLRQSNDLTHYLKSGLLLQDSQRRIADSYDPADSIGCNVYTDDVYCWDDTIIHWVHKYRAGLPPAFMAHFKKFRHQPVPHESLSRAALIPRYRIAQPVFVYKPVTQLKNLVLYRENSPNPATHIASFKHHTQALLPLLADEIARYLQAGMLLAGAVEEDSMEEGCEEATPRIYTDGIYCWNDIVIEWVSQYQVQLPDDFLTHFHSMKYEPIPHEWLDAMALKALYETSEVVLVV